MKHVVARTVPGEPRSIDALGPRACRNGSSRLALPVRPKPEINKNETDRRISSHSAERSSVASIEPDAHSQRGFSRADGKSNSRSAPLAPAAEEREHAAQTCAGGRILLR